MRRILAGLCVLLVALAAVPALAAPAAVIEGVQMPAWLERAGAGAVHRLPVAPGMELRSGDEVRTGPGSRLYIKLAEGSLVKLGENASLRILDIAPERDGLFKAALNVLEGAFRFTTDLLSKQRRREVSIRVATVTAGIRGTDLWGKSSPDRETVCLIDGKIEVGAEGESPVVMDQARQFYRREQGKTQPVGFVEPVQLAQWARETEIVDGRGAVLRGGKWKVTLARAATQGAALEVYDRLRSAGYAAQIYPTMADGERRYLVRIAGLPTKADAEALVEQLRGTAGVEDPKVSG